MGFFASGAVGVSGSMSPDKWKAWKAFQEEDGQSDATYAEYRLYQLCKDELTFTEFREYMKDTGLDKRNYFNPFFGYAG